MGLEGSQSITWDKALFRNFNFAQAALRNPQTLTIPQKSDQLLLTVDASPINKDLSTTLLRVTCTLTCLQTTHGNATLLNFSASN